MNNNGGYYAIKGFLYQFDKALIEILRNPSKKVRIGKQCTNRYFLTKKTQWKTISEVCLKDYSEVCHTDFRGLRDKLQRFATQTSNRKETQKKGNTKERH